MTTDTDIREAIFEGAAIELYIDDHGYYVRIGWTDHTVDGRSAAEVFLKIADILSTPVPEGRGQQ